MFQARPSIRLLTCAGFACALAAFLLPAKQAAGGQQQPSQPLGALAPGPLAGAPDRAAALEAEAESLARESRTLLGELRKLEVERDRQNERARLAAVSVAEAEAALEQADASLAEIETQRVAQLPDVSARLVDLYKRGRAGNVRLLLGASSVRDLARVVRAVAAMASATDQRLGQHQQLLARARAERSTRAQSLLRVQAERRKVEQSRSAAAAAVQARTRFLADIDTRRDLTAQLAGELQVAARKLDEQVTTVSATPPPTSPTSPVFPPRLPVRGGLEWPVEGRVSGRFGEASTRLAGAAPRNGVEIDAPEGTLVRAIHPGTVVFAAPLAGFGTLVILDHSRGYHTVYGYLASTSLRRGDALDVGHEVGRVGSTPGGPPALYFEFRIDGRSVDPVQWLRPR